jgi:integrase
MGSVYPRGSKLWLAFKDENGKRRLEPTGLPVGQETKARKILESIERRIAANKKLSALGVETGPLTVARYAAHWIADRKQRKVGTARKEEYRFKVYVFSFVLAVESKTFGEMRPADMRPSHLRDLVRHLKAQCGAEKDQMAPRTVRHIYGALRTMFGDMVADEHLSSNPCTLKKGELPKKVDKNPAWRSQAVFVREEVEQLISDERISIENRVLYALLFLCGMRIGEVAARRWRDYDAKAVPLGRLIVPTSYSRQEKRVKGVKTDVPREVPVHPTLARVLAAWRLSGFKIFMGQAPRPDDLIIPSPTGQHLDDTVVLRRLGQDLETLGLRRRTTHNTRRTFISIARADGANKDVVKCITHGAKGDQVDDYTTFPWSALCEAVLKIQISLREGKLLSLPLAAGASEGASGDLLQPLLHPKTKTQNPEKESNVMATQEIARGGNRTPISKSGLALFGDVSNANSEVSDSANIATRDIASADCSNVAISFSPSEVALLREALQRGLASTGADLFRVALTLLKHKGGGR